MRVLLIKTSSMGDLIHTFPALTDAGRAIPGITFDWVVEEAFVEIPGWHPLVKNSIPIALRRWRRNVWSRDTRAAWRALWVRLQQEKYDLILDAQGLVKSAIVARLVTGVRAGLDWSSARESLASLAYQKKYTVNFYQHAVHRMRLLFSLALGYPLPVSPPDFGLDISRLMAPAPSNKKYVVFLHGTTWKSKEWPEDYWRTLAKLIGDAGYDVKISGNNDEEIKRAERIGDHQSFVAVLPRLSIPEMASLLRGAAAVVSVDTGFGHLAAALNVQTISIYGSTNPDYTGALGLASVHLAAKFPCSPCLERQCTYRGISSVKPACYETISPHQVFHLIKL